MFTYEMRPRRMLMRSSSFGPPAQLVVQRVPLHGDATGVADEADELIDLLLRLGLRARSVEDLLADDRALDVVRARRVAPAAPLEDGVLRVERERDEREEAARPVLLVAEAKDVVDALLVGLDVAVEHGAVRRDPELVRSVMDVE